MHSEYKYKLIKLCSNNLEDFFPYGELLSIGEVKIELQVIISGKSQGYGCRRLEDKSYDDQIYAG